MSLMTFIRGIFNDPATNTPSSSRVLMFIFSGFTIWLLCRIFCHLFRMTDTAQLSIWLSNIPLIIASFCGLIALPYTVNRGSDALKSTFEGIASMMSKK